MKSRSAIPASGRGPRASSKNPRRRHRGGGRPLDSRGPLLRQRAIAQALADGRLPHDITPPVTSLSPRELEIFTHIGGGLTVSQIAASLGLSIKTVEAHRENIKNKLAHQNSSQVIAAAVRWIDTSSISI